MSDQNIPDPQPGEVWVCLCCDTHVQVTHVTPWRIYWSTGGQMLSERPGNYTPPSIFRRLFRREEAP